MPVYGLLIVPVIPIYLSILHKLNTRKTCMSLLDLSRKGGVLVL